MSAILTVYFWLFLIAYAGWNVFCAVHTVITSYCENIWFSDLRGLLSALLYRGYHDSYVTLIDRQTGQTIGFHKYIRGKGTYGLEYRVSGSEWSKRRWHEYQAIADENGIEWKVVSSTEESGNPETLILDFGKRVWAAYDFAAIVWTRVFGLTKRTPYNLDHDEWATIGEYIDGPDHAAPLASFPEAVRKKEFLARYKTLKNPGCLKSVSLILLVTLEIVSGIGFPIAMLRSRGESAEWSIDFGAFDLAGGYYEITLLVIFLSAHVLAESLLSKMQMYPHLRAKWELTALEIIRIFVFTLPVAALLAWAGY